MPDIDGLEVLREIRAIRDGRPQSRHANSSISSALCTSREVGAHHR